MRLPFAALPFLLLTSACTYTGSQTANAPIVMGDSSTIVTETDSQYLRSVFSDYETTLPVEKEALPATPPKADTVATPPPAETAVTPLKSQNGPGLAIDFGDFNVFIENLRVRNEDASAKGSKSVAYASDGSAFKPKNLIVTGVPTASLKQKADFELVVNTGKELLPLPALGKQSTGWQTISGKEGSFRLAAPSEPSFKITPATVKSAAQQAARKARMASKDQTALLNRLGRLKKVDGDLLQPRTVATLWQVTAKDAKGRSVTKEIRVDW